MAFIIETGSGEDAGANSYASVAAFKAYWSDRGFDFSVYSPDVKFERALIAATDYIEMRFGRFFRGRRLNPEYPTMQPLSWPRYAYYCGALVEGLPDVLVRATIEYARRALELPTGLSPDPSGYDKTGQLISESSKKVAAIEVRTKFEAGSGFVIRQYPTVDAWLSDLLAYPAQVIRN